MRDRNLGFLTILFLFGWIMIPIEARYERNNLIDSKLDIDTVIDRIKPSYNEDIKLIKNNKVYRKSKFYSVLATKYNPTVSQCNEDPFHTADMSKIDMTQLNSHNLKWIAVSRDLLNQFNLGDTVEIKCDNNRLSGVWVIHDLMNKRWKNRIDFLVPKNDKYEFYKPTIVNIRKLKLWII